MRQKFLSDLKNANFSFTSADPIKNYLFLTNLFFQNSRETSFFKNQNHERKSCAFCFEGTKESYLFILEVDSEIAL